jgi:putative PIN family toxin of toxin-antitoxin system
MRVMLDTNVLISVFVFRSSHINAIISKIVDNYRLVLSSFVIEELTEVVKRKFPDKINSLDIFLTALSYELSYTPRNIRKDLFQIRDETDYPVLYSAIIEDVDILVTGDKDFKDVLIDKPVIMTPSEFVESY